jgi:hypothetical protein
MEANIAIVVLQASSNNRKRTHPKIEQRPIGSRCGEPQCLDECVKLQHGTVIRVRRGAQKCGFSAPVAAVTISLKPETTM